MTIQNISIPITGITFNRLLRFLPSNAYQLRHSPKNTYLYSPTQKQTHLYLLQKGRVKIGTQINENQQHIQQIIWEGELFGELILFRQNSENGFAQALEKVEYYVVEVKAMQQLLQQNWMAQIQVLEVFNNRLHAAQSRLVAQQTQDTHTRIIDFLLHIAKEKGNKVGKYGYFVAPFFKQTNIAALTGCSLPAVGLVMRKLKEENLIVYSSKQLRIYHLHELKQIHQKS